MMSNKITRLSGLAARRNHSPSSAPCRLIQGEKKDEMEKIMVTRHAALVQYLTEIYGEMPVIEHATKEAIEGKHVFGVLPLGLAVHTAKLTTVSFPNLPKEKRGFELTLEEMKEYGVELETFHIVSEADANWANKTLAQNGCKEI